MSAKACRLVGLALVLAITAAACTAGSSKRLGPQPPGAEPAAGGWRTWVLSSPTDVTVPPPPAPGSAEALDEAQELRDLAADRPRDAADLIAPWDGVGEPVSAPWVRMAMDLVSARPDDPPASSRAYALLAVAAYDAMVATWHYKYRYNRAAPAVVAKMSPSGADPSYPSEHAAIAGAAASVLGYLFPERTPSVFDEAARQAARSRLVAGANWRSDITAGLDLGRQVADRVIAYGRADGSDQPCDRQPPGGRPEYWAPATGVVAGPVQPCAGDWRPWVLSSGSQLRPGPPPVLGSPEFADQAQEVANERIFLTADKMRAVSYWAAGAGTPQPAGLWNEVMIAYLRERKPSEPHAERTMAMANVAMADAAVAAWDAKYAYWDPRPENGVPDSGVAPDWKPYLAKTPLSPAYVSGHGAYAGAIAMVLSWIFPENQGAFRDKAVQASDAQVWGGAEWGLARSAGRDLGTEVAKLVIERARTDGAPPLPPARKP